VVRRVSWTQESGERVALDIELAASVWGYRTRWSGGDLLLEVRRPPTVNSGRPLEGRLIMVDPGHPPVGATGPTGLYEAEANLAVGNRLRDLLTRGGAKVVMTRTTGAPVELGARVRLADSLNAELLVSIHNNALPDGVNPFTNNGTAVYYSQPRSLPLARAIQAALVARLGLRDLGVGRGDLALTRPTWMPAVLCEGLFMTMPDQEAALRTKEGQELYAKGVYEGIVAFLKNVSGER
jgi:N-acetylmuramoyl-L-alanine amidase